MGKQTSLQKHFKEHLVLVFLIMISQLSHIAIAVADNVMVVRRYAAGGMRFGQ